MNWWGTGRGELETVGDGGPCGVGGGGCGGVGVDKSGVSGRRET